MSYQVLARKWRPRNFSEMAGQEHVLRALINALDNNRLHHAYLFTGTRGVGKTTVARIFAKSLNCETGLSSRPCGVCSACKAIDEGRFVDLIEVDAASRTKVEDTRELLENVQYAPTRGRYKVYLIDEVHMLSTSSFNALLKTLEEPPPHIKFLLATTDPQRLPVTILSRCLQFNLKRLPLGQINAHLQQVLKAEGIASDQAAIAHITRAADGSMRDALSLLDQAIAYGGGHLKEADVRAMLGTIESTHIVAIAEALAKGDAQAALNCVATVAEQAPDFTEVLESLLALLHRVALAQIVPQAVDDSEGDKQIVMDLAQQLSAEDVQLFYQIGLLGRRDLPYAPDARGGLEMVLLRMLAFRPAAISAQITSSTIRSITPPKVPAKPVVVPVAPVAYKNAADDTPASQVPALQIEEPSTVAYAAVEQTPTLTANTTVEPQAWAGLVQKLKLDGMARQLASNCVLERWQGSNIHLALGTAHTSLRGAKVEERLQIALSEYSGVPVKLNFSIGSIQQETPALQQDRREHERLQVARAAIENDPNVKAFKESFNARVIPESVKPKDQS